MAVKSRGETKTSVRRQRGGGPSMKVPGKGNITCQKGIPDGRSAENFTKPMSKVFGESGGHEHEYSKE